MKNKAIGLIEVKGYLGAVLAADACLKAANVSLLHVEKIRGGLTTIKLTGDVGAVIAAIEAGVKAVEHTSSYVSSHIIPRVHQETTKLLQAVELKKEETSLDPLDKEDGVEHSTPVLSVNETVVEKKDEEVQDNQTKEKLNKEAKAVTKQLQKIDVTILEKMKVVELRRLARSLKIPNIHHNDINFGRKEELIRIISEFYRKEGNK